MPEMISLTVSVFCGAGLGGQDILGTSLEPDTFLELVISPVDGSDSHGDGSLGGTNESTSLSRRMSYVGTDHHGIGVKLGVRDSMGDSSNFGLNLHRY
jgi:hypothetical protein